MKILCICEWGNNRSTNLATVLRKKYYAETIATGTRRLSEASMRMLCTWADYIIIVEEKLINEIIRDYMDKVQVWEIGPDVYPRPYNPDLDEVCKKLAKEHPLT